MRNASRWPLRFDAGLAGVGLLPGAFRVCGSYFVAGVASVSVLLAAEVLLCSQAVAQATARIPVNALPSTPKTQYGSAITYAVNGNKATITQTAPTNIVSWKSFDIGSAASVNIKQPSAAAVLLNKVEGGAYLNKTVIDGMLNANGRVYIYNPNGIIFGKTATVNVDTMIASSLKFDESRVIGGLVLRGSTPVLGADPDYVGGVPGAVVVEGDGSQRAMLTSGTNGLILLAGPSVINNGVLTSRDGQVMLAAGSKVYLAAPTTAKTGTSLRGLVVEVSNDYPVGALGVTGGASAGTSTAENGESGQISVSRGNATMIGYAVNQKGLVSATTSVNLNGSIYLYARDQATQAGVNDDLLPKRSGTLVLGPNSVTQVQPDLNDSSTITASGKFNQSVVNLNGADIELQTNAKVIAPGGNVDIKAQSLPVIVDRVTVADPKIKVRVDFAPGSLVDVSGTTGTQLAMESNVINVDLRGTELADNTILRDSPLYATKVNVDIRKGTQVANISGWLDLVKYGLGELNAAGGTVNVSADGAIIQRAGSQIKVDGGYVDYLPGYVNTTKLQLNDKLVDIGSALPNTLYSAAVNLPDSTANYEAGYRQGSSAGTVKLAAPIIVQQGELSGQVTIGSHQRDVAAVSHPQGGQLQIGNVSSDSFTDGIANVKSASSAFDYLGKLVIGRADTEAAAPPEVGAAFDTANADQRLLVSRLNLDTAALANAGFNGITALVKGDISVIDPVTLAPGGHLWLGAGTSTGGLGGNVSFDAPVTIPGGSLNAVALRTLQVRDGVSLDLAGRWVNDRALSTRTLDAQGNPITPLAINGGQLRLSANQLVIGNGVKGDVSSGAWLNASSRTNYGNAGGIKLVATPADATGDATLQLGSGLVLSGYGFNSGGKLTLAARNVTVEKVSTSGSAADLSLQPDFFQQGGFTNYDIVANVNFAVAKNTVVKPRALSWQFNSAYDMASSGNMNTVVAPYLFDLSGPARIRPTTDVSFQALSTLTPTQIATKIYDVGGLVVNTGAQLVMDPGANLRLLAGQQLTIDGLLNAPAGHIVLGLTPDSSAPFSDSRSIWFGPNAKVLATGSVQRLYTNGDGVSSGEVLDGGSIQIVNVNKVSGEQSAANGYVVAESGSEFNVSGTAATKLRFKSSGTVTPAQDVASSGGSIEIRASEGLLFAGTLQGGAGGVGASGGSLTVALENARSNLDNERALTISQNAPTGGIVPKDLQPGAPIVVSKDGTGEYKGLSNYFLVGSNFGLNARQAGSGWITTKSFASGGFDRLTFRSQDVLAFGLGAADLTLSARDSIVLNAPTLRADSNSTLTTSQLTSDPLSGGHTLALTASYIQLGSADPLLQIPEASSTGNAKFKANATTLDLIGNSALQGFGEADLNAKADIRLVGVNNTVGLADADGNAVVTNYSQGSLVMTGNLTLTDAQTYPTTKSEYTFMVAANPDDTSAGLPGTKSSTGVLTFTSNGNTPQQVLSAGGSLVAVAPHIIQDGQVVAPFGSITLGNIDQTPLAGTPPAFSDTSFSVTKSVADGTPVSLNNPTLFGSFVLNNLRFPTNPVSKPDKSSSPIITNDLTYSPRSVTSVAGAGMVPFGNVVNGSVPTASDWQVSLDDGTAVSLKLNPTTGGSLLEGALPEKSIVSSAKNIKVDRGSAQNLSGGGSLFAYEFTAGKGGSKDVLADSNTYAINPNYQGNVAPIDGTYANGSLLPGSKVYLSGMPGLPAGIYTLLPAHYALLPGGFSISAASNTRDMQVANNFTQLDGSMLVAGRLLGSGSTRSNGFIVSSGEVVRKKSEFTIFDATPYFADKAKAAGVPTPELPVDGGYIAFNARGASTVAGPALVLNGTIKLGAADGGRAGTADISAPNIVVVSNSGQGTGDAVQLVAGDLNALGADSLLLGGLRDTAGGVSQHISVGAISVALRNDAQHSLTGAEIVLAATDGITLESGASLQGTGALARTPQDLALDGGAALLRVSSGSQVSIARGDTTAKTGTLSIAEGATVAASGSANLDSTGSVSLKGQLALAPGSALSLAANGIRLGSDFPADTVYAGLQFDTAGLAQLSGLDQLAFNSYASAIDLYGTVNLGSSAMRKLSFKGAGFQGHGNADELTSTQATFKADTVRFDGPLKNAKLASPANLPGKLAVQANTIEIGDNAFAIRGIADTELTARGQLIAKGAGGQLVADNNMTLAAALIDTASGSVAGFKAGGSMTLTGVSDPQTPASVGMGGQLSFAADSIVSDAQIIAPSGKVTLSAPSGIDIAGGLISVAGGAVDFGTTTKYAPAGSIVLNGGSVAVDKAATLDLSAVGAAAGALSIAANNGGYASVQLNGTLKANATAGIDGVAPTQGQFSLDADQADAQNGQFGALNAGLNAAGFNESRQFRYRNGDVQMGGTDDITAHQVVIAADNGNISIGGAATIDASGAKGGSIELYAAQTTAGGDAGKVTLGDNALLDAHATAVATSDAGSTGNGGRIVIGTAASANGDAASSVSGGGSISLQGGSIDVAGSSVARNGSVTLRAPRLDNGSDVAIASLTTAIRNSGSTTIEAYKVYQASTISATSDSDSNLDARTGGRMYVDASKFIADNKANILKRLGVSGNASVGLSPGIEVRGVKNDANSSGNLKVSVNEFAPNAADRGWNLYAWRFDGAPVALTLRAAGDLKIVGSISDGFVTATNPKLAMPDWALASGASASYRLSGGADYAAANPLAVNAAGSGDVYFGFADRVPKANTTIQDNPDGTQSTVAVPWRSTDGTLRSSSVTQEASAALVTITDAPVALVRTGTGRIDVAAGHDVTLGMAKFFVNQSSDVTIDGTPVIPESLDATYKVSLYGASLYTAGRTTNVHGTSDFATPPSVGSTTSTTTATDAAALTAPQNVLNTHYGATAKTLSDASFGTGGGAITVYAAHDVKASQDLKSDWYYRNGDGEAAYPFDPDSPDYPATPAVPGTKVMLSTTVPQLVNDWLFRQGRSYVDTNGKVVFEKLADGKTLNTAWWTRYDYFKQGIATFGGGDVRITAANNVTDLAASVATSAYIPGASPGTLKELGGGDLVVRAGADIRGGMFYVQKGAATLRADGSVTAGSYVPAASYSVNCNDCSTTPLNPVLALGDGQVNVTAGRNLAIETTFNPMLTMQSENNVVTEGNFGPIYGVGTGSSWIGDDAFHYAYRQNHAQFSNFSTYGDDSSVKLTAVGGDLLLSNDPVKLSLASPNDIPNFMGITVTGGYSLDSAFAKLYLLEPSTFSAVALSGNLSSLNGFTLRPSARGQLDLLAAGDVTLSNGVDQRSRSPIRMLDNDPSAMSNLYAPRVLTLSDLGVLDGSVNGIYAHTLGGLHSGDLEPVRIVALTGNIVGDGKADVTVVVPKETQIQAGRDIIDLGMAVQHNSASDVTTVVAGRDIVDTTLARSDHGSSLVSTVVTGPGRIDISAGRNVDLGNGSGVVTRGNIENPYLPEGGASINVVAGAAQPNYKSLADYLAQYGSVYAVSTSPTTLTVAEQSDLVAYMRSLQPDSSASLSAVDALKLFKQLTAAQQSPYLVTHQAAADILALVAFVSERKPELSATASAEQTWAAFRALPKVDQDTFLNNQQGIAARLATLTSKLAGALPADGKPVDSTLLNAAFFSGLVEAARLVERGNDASLAKFDDLIASLFPSAKQAHEAGKIGNISSFGSQFKTEQGGSIDLFAPTGSVYAGLTTGTAGSRSPSTMGVFTIRGGAIGSLVRNDFLVNKGRVFTLRGGDITLVSQYGDIDAGRGAKTASSAPPPLMTIDANGSVKLDVSNSISGSGIATLMTHEDQPPSNVYLIAPRGIVDAGDAGVRSTGTVEVNAPVVMNGNNITAAGAISGASSAVAEPSLGSIAAPANATSKSDDAVNALSNAAQSGANAALSVEVLGYGDAATADDDAADDAADDSSDGEPRKKKKKKL